MAVAYCKLETGSTTYTLTALTGCIASNPSGTITRINKVGHGLTTGQLVNLTLFSTWLNRTWSVTVVNADNFDLVEAVWQTTADNNGTVTPFNGYSWATAIKEPEGLFNQVTFPRPEIEIRVEKSPNAYSVGNATWTDGSGTVTLATAQTKTIDNCEVAWTAANSATVTRVTTSQVKQGTNRKQIAVPAVLTTNTKYAYYDLGSNQDFSAYQRISYWLQPSSTSAIDADTEYKICLCSDTTGDTIVDEFILPRQNYNASDTMPFTIERNGGGNLGNSIRSVALYTSTTTPTGSTNIRLDNIIACTSTGLNLMSVISKCNVSTYDYSQDPWFAIDSIDGTSVQLDSHSSTQNCNETNNTYYKYVTEGTSPETVTTYARELILMDTKPGGFAFSSLATLYAVDNYFIVNGGWNPSTDSLDGVTFTFMRVSSAQNRYAINGGSSSETVYPRNALIKNFGFQYWTGLGFFNSAYQRNASYENIYGARTNTMIRTDGMMYELSMNNISFTGASGESIISTTSQIINNVKHYGLGALRLNLLRGTFKNFFFTGTAPNTTAKSFITTTETDTDSITVYGNSSVPANEYHAGVAIGSLYNGITVLNNLKVKRFTNGVFYTNGNVILNSPTFSNNTNSFFYVSGNASQATLVTNNLVSTDTNVFGFSTTSVWSNILATLTLINNAIGGNKNSINHYYKFLNRTAGLANNAWGLTASAQTSVRHTASGIAWQINPLNININETNPFRFKIASVAVNASSLVTVKVWVKLSHATDIGAKLFIPGGQISGPTSNTSATKSANTNWEELTVTFTPSIQGVVDIYVQAYWRANVADESVYVDDVTVAQA